MSNFALVDCNNFFASCERAFNPALENKPVVVLSNNDGCVIARSNEAKALGIPMGAPYFKWKDLCRHHHVNIFSTNFPLYADMSQRVMTSLEQLCPDIEIYSIDEAFLKLDHFIYHDIEHYLKDMRQKVLQWTGIPISIGYAPTKTLAKMANHIAKKQTSDGVFSLHHPATRHAALANFAVEDIWGIGRRLSKALHEIGIQTAFELSQQDPKVMRKRFNIMVERTITELNGIACFEFGDNPSKKQIISSRSFGKPTSDFEEVQEALSHYTANACIKLRKQHSKLNSISVFIHTNLFSQKDTPYRNIASHHFAQTTSDTRIIIAAAKKCLKSIFKPGLHYQKTGIILCDLQQEHLLQNDMLQNTMRADNNLLMQTVDQINQKIGKQTVFYCAEGIERPWMMRSTHKSASYTTNWQQLPIVYCK